jgi:hypothetical protein
VSHDEQTVCPRLNLSTELADVIIGGEALRLTSRCLEGRFELLCGLSGAKLVGMPNFAHLNMEPSGVGGGSLGEPAAFLAQGASRILLLGQRRAVLDEIELVRGLPSQRAS